MISDMSPSQIKQANREMEQIGANTLYVKFSPEWVEGLVKRGLAKRKDFSDGVIEFEKLDLSDY